MRFKFHLSKLALGLEQYRILVMTSAKQTSVTAKFRKMHESGCFVLPNPWDIGTTICLENLGFEALATTSAGFAFSRGKFDGGVPRDEMLAHIREIVEATTLPVNADFLAGYADEPERVAANVRLCVATGVAGLSIEDNTGRKDVPLYEKKLAIDRIRAARSAIEASGSGVVLTGRCEAWLVHDPDPFHTVLDRLAAYAEAGADCLYAPGVSKPDEIAQIVKTVAPKPVNVLVSGFNHQLITVPTGRSWCAPHFCRLRPGSWLHWAHFSAPPKRSKQMAHSIFWPMALRLQT